MAMAFGVNVMISVSSCNLHLEGCVQQSDTASNQVPLVRLASAFTDYLWGKKSCLTCQAGQHWSNWLEGTIQLHEREPGLEVGLPW